MQIQFYNQQHHENQIDDESLSDKNEVEVGLTKIPSNQVMNSIGSFNLTSQQMDKIHNNDLKLNQQNLKISGLPEVRDDPNSIQH